MGFEILDINFQFSIFVNNPFPPKVYQVGNIKPMHALQINYSSPTGCTSHVFLVLQIRFDCSQMFITFGSCREGSKLRMKCWSLLAQKLTWILIGLQSVIGKSRGCLPCLPTHREGYVGIWYLHLPRLTIIDKPLEESSKHRTFTSIRNRNPIDVLEKLLTIWCHAIVSPCLLGRVQIHPQMVHVSYVPPRYVCYQHSSARSLPAELVPL